MTSSCFGFFWDGAIDSKCTDGKGCQLLDKCLNMFAVNTLVQHQVELGESATPVDLSKRTHVSAKSIRKALAYQRAKGITPEYKPPKRKKRPPPKPKAIPKKKSKTWVWSENHDIKRWIRERDRNPEIGMLCIGMRLTRMWKGKKRVVTVGKYFYEHNGKKYPTLQSVTNAIAGTKSRPKQKKKDGTRPKGTRELCSWGAVRFFNLKQLLKLHGRG